MKISIVCVGKLKEKFYRDAADEYAKRLSRYCRLEVLEVADEKAPERLSAADEERVRQKEAERILAKLKPDACVISLEIEGNKTDSVGFSELIEASGIGGVSHIQFVIGGSLGLHDSVSKRADRKLSFSDLTFPHQLMRVILLEQIYRAYRIITGEPYHK